MLLTGLRVWLAVVGSFALFSAIQSYLNGSTITDKIYTIHVSTAKNEDALLTARLFGLWTTLSATVRLLAAADIKNRKIYFAALMSFIIAFLHFISEATIYQTAGVTPGLILPVAISGFSIAWMVAMLPFIPAQGEDKKKQ